MLTPEEIAAHHEEGEVEYVDAHQTDHLLRVVEPDPAWAGIYVAHEVQIRKVLGERVVEIQHVGSTAVPGLPAKPIIDIDLTVADPVDEAAYVPALQSLGFVHWLREPDWHQHRLFKHLGEPRVHLHAFGPGCPEPVRHRMFRDWLIAHPDDRQRYAEAKRSAADELATSDGQGSLGFGMVYNRIKEPVVHEIYDRMFRAVGLLTDH